MAAQGTVISQSVPVLFSPPNVAASKVCRSGHITPLRQPGFLHDRDGYCGSCGYIPAVLGAISVITPGVHGLADMIIKHAKTAAYAAGALARQHGHPAQ